MWSWHSSFKLIISKCPNIEISAVLYGFSGLFSCSEALFFLFPVRTLTMTLQPMSPQQHDSQPAYRWSRHAVGQERKKSAAVSSALVSGERAGSTVAAVFSPPRHICQFDRRAAQGYE